MSFFGKLKKIVSKIGKKIIGDKTRTIGKTIQDVSINIFKTKTSSLTATERLFGTLAHTAYKNPRPSNIGKYTYIPALSNSTRAIYKNDNSKEIVYAIRGTADLNDFKTDLEIVKATNPSNIKRFQDDLKFYDKLRNDFPEYKIILTSHSLGGSISNYIATQKKDATGYAFNTGVGINTILSPRIRNIRTINDPISILKAKQFNKIIPSSTDLIEAHSIKNFSNLPDN